MQYVFKAMVLILSLLGPGALFAETESSKTVNVVEVKIDGSIDTPQVYILRRALREAVATTADAVVVNMDTPGGSIDAMMQMMELLADFKGKTICYINPNAISAGSFIANSCDEIWFSPKGIMGAAEAVGEDGKDLGESMARKIRSVLTTKVKAVAGEGNPNRLLVQEAMMNPDMELEIGGALIKKKGDLLSLTANDAVKIYEGHPLLADGIAENVSDLLRKSYSEGVVFKIDQFETSPLEKAAKIISMLSPILMGIGMFLLFMELKTGGFGVMGIIGICLILLVFFGAHSAGLAGYEAPILFILGIILIALEFFVLPGVIIFAASGIALVIISLVLAGASPMPSEGAVPSISSFASGIANFGIGLAIALICLLLFGRLFKHTPFWRMLVLDGGLGRGTQGEIENTWVGKQGVALSTMVPNGKVEIGDKVLDATSFDGAFIEKGTPVEVVSSDSFQLKIKKLEQ